MTMLFRDVRPGSQKARIWEICDELTKKHGSIPSSREVVDIYVAEGGNPHTGATQHSLWKKAYFAQADEQANDDQAAEQGLRSLGFRPITISPEGHVVIPKDVLRTMMLDSDGRATLSVVEGELRIISPLAALQAMQNRLKGLNMGGGLVSDELIAERRAEAASE